MTAGFLMTTIFLRYALKPSPKGVGSRRTGGRERGGGGVGNLTVPAWTCRVGVGARASDWQVVEAPWPLVLARNGHPEKLRPIKWQEVAQHTERESGHKGYGGTRDKGTPRGKQGPGRRRRAANFINPNPAHNFIRNTLDFIYTLSLLNQNALSVAT